MAKVARSDIDRLPHSEDAERAVAGSVLIDPDAVLRAQETGLLIDHFYNKHLGWIYEAAQVLVAKGQPTDITLIGQKMSDTPNGNGTSRLETLGGYSQLTRLIDTIYTSVNVSHYAKIVVDNARKRSLLAAAANIVAMVGSHEGDIDELMSEASRAFLPAVSVEGQRTHTYGSENTLLSYITGQQERADRLLRDPDALLVTGLGDLDKMLGDLVPGYLHVVAARSSVGKTMYMECVTEINAKRNKKVAFYHLELSHETMLDRLVARHSDVPMWKLRQGYNGMEIGTAIDMIVPWFKNIVFVHCPGWSAERIAADIQRLSARGECDIACVDYLQKLALPNTRASLNAAMLYGLQAETLKIAAETCEIPIVLGSQVNRDFKTREDKRPTADDIRNSGEVLEKANQVVILHRPGERKEHAPHGDTEMLEAIIEKNTGGGSGKAEIIHVMGRFLLASVEHF